MNANSGPGYEQHPEHRVTTRPAGQHVEVRYNGEVIADTRDAVALHEPHVGHVVAPVIYYIPREDVKLERLERTSHESYCPFKGQAAYYSIKDGPENAVWTYEAPYDEVLPITGHLAFYPDKVEISATAA